MRMVPYAEKAKEKGPSTGDASALKAWLEGTKEAVLRVPITVIAGGMPGERWELKIGALDIAMSDSALGVSFEDRVRQASQGTRPVVVWVEGRWREGKLHIIHFSRRANDGEPVDFVEREK
ncbi:MAG: hypothetical protein JNM17_39235 [Archangium sp.]|nr:hypothetical protein [Archangium sp.]